jgi:hypothetical protein
MLFPMLNVLYLYISTSRSTCAVPSMAVVCSCWMSCFTVMLLRYFPYDFEMVRVAPIITGITFIFALHKSCIYILRSLYFRIFSASFLVTFLSREIAASIYIHVSFFFNTVNGVRFYCCGMVLSVCTRWFHSMVTLHSWLVSTNCGHANTIVHFLIVSVFPRMS